MAHSSGRSLALACAAASAAVALPAKAQDSDVAALRGEVADLKATVDALKAEIAAMKQDRNAGAAQIAEAPPTTSATDQGAGAIHIAETGRTPPAPPQTPEAPRSAPSGARVASGASSLGVMPSPLPGRETIGDRITGASRPDNESPPNDPELKGFIPIPGTETAVRIGGFAKVDLIYDPRFVGDRDQFAVPSIPFVNKARNRADVSARATRFSLEIRRPSTLGNLRFYVENDFYGDGTDYSFHLNHAYGQVGNTYGGYGYSALVDADALPDTLDNWGPGGAIFVRQASVRQSFKVARGTHLTLSLEQPDTDLSLADDQTGAETMPMSSLSGATKAPADICNSAGWCAASAIAPTTAAPGTMPWALRYPPPARCRWTMPMPFPRRGSGAEAPRITSTTSAAWASTPRCEPTAASA